MGDAPLERGYSAVLAEARARCSRRHGHARHRDPGAARAVASRAPALSAVGRLLRLELRHNVMLWMAPLIAVLFYFDAYRAAMGYAALWSLRASKYRAISCSTVRPLWPAPRPGWARVMAVATLSIW